MTGGFVTQELLTSALRTLGEWSDAVPVQPARHVWSLLPVKLAGAEAGVSIAYSEADDAAFMNRFLRMQGTAYPFFDPFVLKWLPESFPHSNLSTFRKNTFRNSWRACTWEDDLLVLADDYASRFADRVLTKGGSVTRIPAVACAIWFYKKPSTEWPEGHPFRSEISADASTLIQQFRTDFSFEDDVAFDLIFDEDRDLSPWLVDSNFAASELTPHETLESCEQVARDRTPAAQTTGTTVRTSGVSFGSVLSAQGASRLELPDGLMRRVTAALTHSNVRFIGPPGTGKSTLAKAVLEAAVGDRYEFAVATGDWTGDDVIGGPMPDAADASALVFKPGLVLAAAESGRWVGIDEINRADIDAAFGELFGLLAGFDLDLPYAADTKSGRNVRIYAQRPDGALEVGQYGLPRDWRMIATMNSWDKLSLNRVSFAFSRRWCTIFLPVPAPDAYARAMDDFYSQFPDADLPEVRASMAALFVEPGDDQSPTLRSLDMALGPGVAKSCIIDIAAMLAAGMDVGDAVASSLDGFVLPQLEGALEMHDSLLMCLKRVLGLAGTSGAAMDGVEGKLGVFTGKRAGTDY